MYYQLYELNHAFLSPARALNDAVRLYYKNPLNPFTYTQFGRQAAAAADVFERLTRRYGKPEFGLTRTEVDGVPVAVTEEVVWQRPFCSLIHFKRDLPANAPKQGNLVIVAPMSGHYATLLRGTVEAMLPHHEVYITDWVDARKVPLSLGTFDFADYVDYVCEITQLFGGDVHMVAVCQPAVPVFAATAVMEQDGGVHPKSLTLMGGPIDTRENPTEVNAYAAKHDLDWFRRSVVMMVPLPHPGFMRSVYPGFLQLTGFMTMNLDRHLTAHYDYFDHLVKGDGDGTDKHREFYDEYNSVMDLTAEFYLDTVDFVFLRHLLPKGELTHRGRRVDPSAITKTAIFTVEGEKDDISGIGQTRAAHRLATNLADERKEHYEQEGVGHYGVFNGSRFRREIAPRITEWINRWDSEPALSPRVPEGSRRVPGEIAHMASGHIAGANAAVAAMTSTAADAVAKTFRTAADLTGTARRSASGTSDPLTDGPDHARSATFDSGTAAAMTSAADAAVDASTAASEAIAQAAQTMESAAESVTGDGPYDAVPAIRAVEDAAASVASEAADAPHAAVTPATDTAEATVETTSHALDGAADASHVAAASVADTADAAAETTSHALDDATAMVGEADSAGFAASEPERVENVLAREEASGEGTTEASFASTAATAAAGELGTGVVDAVEETVDEAAGSGRTQPLAADAPAVKSPQIKRKGVFRKR